MLRGSGARVLQDRQRPGARHARVRPGRREGRDRAACDCARRGVRSGEEAREERATMRSKTEAIIISSMNLGEADKLVTFFSLDRGMLKGVAKNARKSFRRFGAGLEAFTYCRLHLYEREHQELIRIESSDILEQHRAISADLG